MSILIHRTVNNTVHIEFKNNNMLVYLNSKKVASFSVEDIWDILKDNLSSMYISKSKTGLYRRKKEAEAAIKFSQEYLKGE